MSLNIYSSSSSSSPIHDDDEIIQEPPSIKLAHAAFKQQHAQVNIQELLSFDTEHSRSVRRRLDFNFSTFLDNTTQMTSPLESIEEEDSQETLVDFHEEIKSVDGDDDDDDQDVPTGDDDGDGDGDFVFPDNDDSQQMQNIY